MEALKTFLQVAQATPRSKATSERASLLEQILEEVNSERRGTKYKPLKAPYLAIRLAHIETKDLYYLISQAKDYKRRHGSFSKYLFGSIRVK